MVLAHELQHHRQRDTFWLYFFRVMSWLCLLNPLCASLDAAARPHAGIRMRRSR